MKFHKDGTLPTNGEIFVFGSNLAGVHGAGAAWVAKSSFGAKLGLGVGPSGQSYAIPTKDQKINTLPIEIIELYVNQFLDFVQLHHDYDERMRHFVSGHEPLQFFITSIGCGLAGYKPLQIAPMFKGAPSNCSFPDTWKHILEPGNGGW